MVIKILSDDGLIGDYGLLFGDRGTTSRYSKDTDFMLDLVPNKPVLWSHNRDDAGVIGWVESETLDDKGIYVTARLDNQHPDYEGWMALIEKGWFGWSSGAMRALLQTDDDGVATCRPILEYSLTPSPKDWRMRGFHLPDSRPLDLPTIYIEVERDKVSDADSGATLDLDIVRALGLTRKVFVSCEDSSEIDLPEFKRYFMSKANT